MQNNFHRNSDTVDTSDGHIALTDIKNQHALLHQYLGTVSIALSHAIEDGLSESLAQNAKEYLAELQVLISRRKCFYLKVNAKFKTGIETKSATSDLSKRSA